MVWLADSVVSTHYVSTSRTLSLGYASGWMHNPVSQVSRTKDNAAYIRRALSRPHDVHIAVLPAGREGLTSRRRGRC